MVLLLKLKQWAWQIGAVLLAILAFFGRIQMLKYQRDKAKVNAALAEARYHVKKVTVEVEKKRSKDLSSSLKEEEKILKEKEFEKSDLVNPNRWD